jgi:hypothetical protein
MSEYTIILKEIKTKILPIQKSIISSAIEYIPKLYQICIKENPHFYVDRN